MTKDCADFPSPFYCCFLFLFVFVNQSDHREKENESPDREKINGEKVEKHVSFHYLLVYVFVKGVFFFN